MFRNLKIGVRLALSFGLILALLGAVTYVGTHGFDGLQHATEDIATNRVPKIQQAAHLQLNAERIALLARDELLSSEKEELQRFLERQAEVRASTDKIMARLQETVVSAEGKEGLQSVVDTLRDYRAAQQARRARGTGQERGRRALAAQRAEDCT